MIRKNLFIIGVGRSGTSLIQSILASHSKIAVSPETGFVRGTVLHWEKNQNKTNQEYLQTTPKFSRIPAGVFEESVMTYPTDLDFYISYLSRYLRSQNKELIGDKDPRLVEFITATAELFPKAKFIHIVRDPRDVLLSKKKAAWSKGKPSWYHIFANYIQIKLGEHQGNELPPEKYLTVIYEKLLDEPENTVKQICDFLNVSFEGDMLSFQSKAKELVAEDEKSWKKETFGPLLRNNKGKWKGKLTNYEVALTELLCKRAFIMGGYERSNAIEQVSFTTKLKLHAQVLLFKSIGFLYLINRLFTQRLLIKWKY